MTYEYSDIMESDSESEKIEKYSKVRHLEGLCENIGVFYSFAVTINHPRSVIFLNVQSDRQKLMYAKIWQQLAYSCNIVTKDFIFEYCKSGQIHLHGLVVYKFVSAGHIIGLISDIVKSLLPALGSGKNKRESFQEASMYSQWNRYRSPAICVQYLDTDKSILDWKIYMSKYQ